MRLGSPGLEVAQPPVIAGAASHEFYRPLENIVLTSRSDEFTNAILDPKWGVTVGGVPAIVDGPVDGFSVPAAGHVRITPNYRGSWLAVRPPGGGTCQVRQLVTCGDFQVRTRFGCSFARVAAGWGGGPPVGRADAWIAFCPDVAGQPDQANNHVRMGWFTDVVSGVPFLQAFQKDGGAFYVTNYPEAGTGLQRTIAGSGEFVICLNASGGNKWVYGFYLADGQFIQFPGGAGWPVTVGQPMWILYNLPNPSAASGIMPDGTITHYIDFFRESTNLNIWTP